MILQKQNKIIRAFIKWISEVENDLHWKLIGFGHVHAQAQAQAHVHATHYTNNFSFFRFFFAFGILNTVVQRFNRLCGWPNFHWAIENF